MHLMNAAMHSNGSSASARPVRAHPLVLGVTLFLASELMFFAGLFAAYFDLRANRAAWPPAFVHLDVAAASIGTLLLALSSVAAIATTRAMDATRIRAARWWTAFAVLCAFGFVAVALNGYVHDTFTIATDSYGSIYFTMTGFHLLHVVVGIGLLVALLAGMRSPALRANARAGAEAMTYYWHFVFVVWLGIWATIYFIR